MKLLKPSMAWLAVPAVLVVGDRILRGATDLATLQGLIREARGK